MKRHIFLLGPPAVGKYSIGRQIAEMTGYPLFDTEKAVGLASLLYAFGTRDYSRYRDNIRLQFYSEVVRSDIDGLISTYCYSRPADCQYLRAVSHFLKMGAFRTFFVMLNASKDALRSRVCSGSRRNKMNDAPSLDAWFELFPLYETLPFDDVLTVDTERHDVVNAARVVVEHVSNDPTADSSSA